MPFSVNKVTLIGNVYSPIEQTVTPRGIACANIMMLLVKGMHKEWEENGEKKEKWVNLATYIKVSAYHRKAEFCKRIKVGDALYIEGHLETRSLLDEKTQEKKRLTEVVAENIIPIILPKEEYPMEMVKKPVEAKSGP